MNRTVTTGDIIDVMTYRDEAEADMMYVECHGVEVDSTEFDRLQTLLAEYRHSHSAQYTAANRRKYGR